MNGRPITPGLIEIARRCRDVLGLSWATIGHLLDRDPTALRRACGR